jgi:hypothetical protein
MAHKSLPNIQNIHLALSQQATDNKSQFTVSVRNRGRGIILQEMGQIPIRTASITLRDGFDIHSGKLILLLL